MKIYTKKGDAGKTSLIGGTRVPKYNLRIEAYGTVDELNSWMGVIRDHDVQTPFAGEIELIQNELFTIGSQLASDPEKSRMEIPVIGEDAVKRLEDGMDAMDAGLPELRNFLLPGGHPANSATHVARCVCRRAERLVVDLSDNEDNVAPILMSYLNRLSDWLFVFSREVSRVTGSPETPWKP